MSAEEQAFNRAGVGTPTAQNFAGKIPNFCRYYDVSTSPATLWVFISGTWFQTGGTGGGGFPAGGLQGQLVVSDGATGAWNYDATAPASAVAAASYRITAGDSLDAMATAGGAVRLVAGDDPTADGATLLLAGANGAGGQVAISAGDSTTQNGGDVDLFAGTTTDPASAGGSLTIGSGDSGGDGARITMPGAGVNNGGRVLIDGGDGKAATGAGGDVLITAGDGDQGGALTLRTGASSGAHNGGILELYAGDTADLTGGFGGFLNLYSGQDGNLNTGSKLLLKGGGLGDAVLTAGDSQTAAGGTLNLWGGTAAAGTGDGGNVIIQAGASAGGNAGNIIMSSLPTVDPGVSGALWNNLGIINISP